MKAKISPSMMCADFGRLEDEIRILEKAGVDYLHIDVMDGHFVPNFAIGPDLTRSIRRLTDIPLDIHLMVERPENYIDLFEPRLGDIVSVHQEATVHLERTLQIIKAAGAKTGVAVNPATPAIMIKPVIDEADVVLVMTVNPGFAGQKLVPSTLSKIREVKEMIQESCASAEIEVDGNVSFENAFKMLAAGADIFVAGTSSIFNADMDKLEAAYKLKQILSVKEG
ncbi:ribulose-phosphate 3-epimerase [Mahella australiensis]|uniref:Ribulose-phosphate 3-epimerase n=1 Tax=Mahella australiensis (strain DSM 15567 / CIP 107919 / 50-1 BON) TaxID=697281 RepID=F4A0Q2_MAHA5|nr:ribulose-phosphate 3-epimerase [Mahella australiensis]AEE96948.1 ribulose-5-phosphate 3-epimerase [Mahella australiensis 50-1 BON]